MFYLVYSTYQVRKGHDDSEFKKKNLPQIREYTRYMTQDSQEKKH